jgi:hypothetical protein
MKGYTITVKNGLLDPKHIKSMRVNQKTSAIWCYLWFLDKITRIVDQEGVKLGIVLGGKPIKLGDIGNDLGLDIKTVRKMYRCLLDNGYIINSRTPYGRIVSVTKAHKIFGQKTDIPYSGRSDNKSGRSVLKNERNAVGLGSKCGRSNKTIQYDNTVRDNKDGLKKIQEMKKKHGLG